MLVRETIRQKGTPYAELGPDDAPMSDDQLLDAMLVNPILINRPFGVTTKRTKLCRPSEMVLEILPNLQQGAFTKEDGEVVINAEDTHSAPHAQCETLYMRVFLAVRTAWPG